MTVDSLSDVLAVLFLWLFLIELAMLAVAVLLVWVLVWAVRRARRPRICPDCRTARAALALWLHRRDPLRRHRCQVMQAERVERILARLSQSRGPHAAAPDPVAVADEFAHDPAPGGPRRPRRPLLRGRWRR